jgi:L-ornithine Nalpha-acyltransferase
MIGQNATKSRPPMADLVPMLRAYGGLRAKVPAAAPLPATLGRIGTLEARLATTAVEVRQAQKLRFQVFYGEMAARPDPAMALARRDMDAFDSVCDHLLVIDHAVKVRTLSGAMRPAVVGTYRLLRQDMARRHGGFYTASEFDIGPLIARHRDLSFLELGRSCVLKPWRNKRTVELLWQGIWTYVRHHAIDVMIGCASLEGTDPDRLALPLSFLHHHATAPSDWHAQPVRGRRVDMNRLAKDRIDMRRALNELPPLIKGYLRLGAHIGDGAVVDRQFGTTDVLIVLPVSVINPRYIEHFSADGGRQSGLHAA